MARQFGELVLAAAVCILSIQTSFSQNSTPAQQDGIRPGSAPNDEASVQAWRTYFQQLPPDEKEKLAENVRRWQALSPEERDLLRQRAAARQQKMQQDAAAAIERSGLTLAPDQREAFVKRYMEERGAVERPLRQEMQRKRKPLLDEMTKQLNAEFAALPPSSQGKSQDVAAKYAPLEQGLPETPQPFQRMEIDRAINQSGLSLDDDRRKFYMLRYIQMRKKIEQQLHTELEQERKPQVDAMVERLKSEFAPAPPK